MKFNAGCCEVIFITRNMKNINVQNGEILKLGSKCNSSGLRNYALNGEG